MSFSTEIADVFVASSPHAFSGEVGEPFVSLSAHAFSGEVGDGFAYYFVLGARLIRGPQLHRAIKQTAWLQGAQAPRGSTTVLTSPIYTINGVFDFSLIDMDKPQSKAAVRAFLGTVGAGRGRLVVQGLDYDLDVDTWTVTWLATARWPLLASNVLTFDYWTQGFYQ